MILSADKLNVRSPYHLWQVNDLTFRFVTDQQIHYVVGFYKDTFFMDDGAYHFFIDNSQHVTVSIIFGFTTTPEAMR